MHFPEIEATNTSGSHLVHSSKRFAGLWLIGEVRVYAHTYTHLNLRFIPNYASPSRRALKSSTPHGQLCSPEGLSTCKPSGGDAVQHITSNPRTAYTTFCNDTMINYSSMNYFWSAAQRTFGAHSRCTADMVCRFIIIYAAAWIPWARLCGRHFRVRFRRIDATPLTGAQARARTRKSWRSGEWRGARHWKCCT